MRLKTFGGLWLESPAAGGALTRPRPLALLAILAAAGSKGMTRDRVLGVLWPETDEDRARHALSQTLYLLRRDLATEVVAASATLLRLDEERITSDIADFRAAVAARRWHEAAALYAGPFLDGFYLAEASEFERWAESERASLATEGVRALGIAAKASADAGRLDEAAEHWRRLTTLEPGDARIAAAYMEALAAGGDRAAALAHGRAYADLVRRELDTEPDPAIDRLMARLREGPRPIDGGDAVADVRPPAVTPATTPLPHHPRRGRARERTSFIVTSLAAAIGVAGLIGWRAGITSSATSEPALAVGRIQDLAAGDSSASGTVSEMLATSLARVDALHVIASSRMLELTGPARDGSEAAVSDAARRAGATELIEGELIPLGAGAVRLEVRRIDLAGGRVRGGYRLTGTDRIALFDSVTALIAADLHAPAPAGSLAEVSTRSPVAQQFYQEGLRAVYQGDVYAAHRLLRLAVRADSTFPMATYYAWRTAKQLSDPDVTRLADRAVALAAHASPRDRLLILTHVGGDRLDPRAAAAAETLATRYPRDREALVRAASVIQDLSRAIQLLDRSLALDSLATPDSAAICRGCEALALLTARYAWADSAQAVERTLARWQAVRPNDPMPWGIRADWLIGFGRREEAEAARRRFETLGGTRSNEHLLALAQSLRLDDLAAADRACAGGLATPDMAEFLRFRWYCVLALRMEGRYRDAIALARDARVPGLGIVRQDVEAEIYQRAILDMEMGTPLVAAREFRTIERDRGDTAAATAGYRAHNQAWLLTLSATAAVSGGDTLGARALADTIERLGRQSLFDRDPKLHHFVRGILRARAHDDEGAVRELRAAISSPAFGYTRINYELGERLLALGRPAEAIPLVQGALHGGIEGSNLYVTRTQLHELLARLFAANRQADSAAAHYAVVERSWNTADPAFGPRLVAARRWLAGHASATRARGRRSAA